MLLLTALATAALLQAAQTAQPPTGLLVGRVVDAGTGQPVASAIVRALPVGGAPTRPPDALTGSSGGFFFSQLPAGEYLVYAERPGYLQGVWGQRRPGGAPARLPLGEGEHLAGLTLRLWPWASISGVVLDDRHQPLPNITVSALRQLPPGSSEDRIERSGTTDASGSYQITGLTPGAYLVGVRAPSVSVMIPASAGPLAAGAVLPNPGGTTVSLDPFRREALVQFGPVRDQWTVASGPETVFVTSYYGGAVTPATATPVDVAAGDERSGIDITLQARPATRVSGIVTGPDGPVPHAVVRLLPGDFDPAAPAEAEDGIAMAVTGQNGEFAFRAAPAGSYLLDAYVPAGRRREAGVSPIGVPHIGLPPSRSDPHGLWSRQPVAIEGGATLYGLAVVLRAGVDVPGTIRVAGAAGPTSLSRPLRVTFAHASPAQPASSSVTLDSTEPARFVVPGVRPGWYVATVAPLPDGWGLEEVVLGGRDVTGMPFEIDAQEPGELAIAITAEPAAIAGRVLDDRGELVRDGTVVLFPTDPSRWTRRLSQAKHIQAVRARGGTYELSGFAAGDYYVAAVDDALMGAFPDRSLLSRLAAGAERVRVEAGQRVMLDLRQAAPGRDQWPDREEVDVSGPAVRRDEADWPLVQRIAAPARVIAIVTDDLGAPLADARVMLTSETAKIARALPTDTQGEAWFDDLPAGRYRLSASAARHVTRGFGQRRRRSQGAAIQLASGMAFRAPIELARAASIAGTVRDEHGQPVPTTVRLFRQSLSNGRTVLRPVASTGSDRRGRFRFAGLEPDDYFVSIGGETGALRRMTPELVRQAEQAVAGGATMRRDAATTFSHPAIYYPDAFTDQTAEPISVGPGEARTGVDLRMRLVEVAAVEGEVMTPAGEDVSYGSVRLVGQGSLAGLSLSGQTSADGSFRLRSVIPGQYVLLAQARPRGAARLGPQASREPALWATTNVVALAGQTTRVTLTLAFGQTITGRVRFEGDGPRPTWKRPQRPQLSLIAREDPFETVRYGSSTPGVIDPDGSFTFDGVPPGSYTFSATRPSFEGWTLESVMADGRDAIDVPFRITAEAGRSDLVATLVDRTASVSGVIVDQAGRPTPHYRVLIYPADPELQMAWSRRIKVGVPDSAGRFRIDDLPPGDYLIAAGTDLEADGSLGPADFAAFVPTSVPLSLSRGEAKVQNFQIAGGG